MAEWHHFIVLSWSVNWWIAHASESISWSLHLHSALAVGDSQKLDIQNAHYVIMSPIYVTFLVCSCIECNFWYILLSLCHDKTWVLPSGSIRLVPSTYRILTHNTLVLFSMCWGIAKIKNLYLHHNVTKYIVNIVPCCLCFAVRLKTLPVHSDCWCSWKHAMLLAFMPLNVCSSST